MPYFASYNCVTAADRSGEQGWVEITEEQYYLGVEAITGGKEVVVEGGFTIRDPAGPQTPYPWARPDSGEGQEG